MIFIANNFVMTTIEVSKNNLNFYEYMIVLYM